MRKIALGALVIVVLAACSNRVDVAVAQALGAAVGAGVGGGVGSQFGSGNDKILLATAGVLFGAASGYRYGPKLLSSDRALYERTAKRAVAGVEDGGIVSWSNADTGHGGIIRPTRSYHEPKGGLCRQYRTSVAFRDGVESGSGIACMQPDGQWKLIEDHFG